MLTIGEAASFRVVTTATPDASLLAGDLPAGLTFTDHDDGTATIAGKPAFDGTSTVQLTATNSVGKAAQQLTIEVRSDPAFTNDATATFEKDAPGSFDLTTTGVPAPQITVTAGDLPKGLRLVDHRDGTATIEGTPTSEGGTTAVTVTATNAEGSTDFTLAIAVRDSPSFTSPDVVRFPAGVAGTFTVTTRGLPPSTIVVDSDLPSWLAFDDFGDGTGTLRTTGPAPAGAFATVTLRAMNAVGADATQTLRVTVP